MMLACLFGLISGARAQESTPPVVSIVSPIDGAVSINTNDLVITVEAADSDGSVRKVALYRDGLFMAQALTSPYVFRLIGLAEGTNVYTAIATDNSGDTAESDPVTIFVQAPLPPYVPPTVTMLSTETNLTLQAPASLTLSASATAFRDNLLRIEFQAVYEPFGTVAIPVGQGEMNPTSVTWSNLAVGHYVFTALARDIYGQSATSIPVTVTVLPSARPIPAFRFVDLGGIDGGDSEALGLNAVGAAVGTSFQPSSQRTAVTWQSGILREFSSSLGPDDGTAINDSGAVAGVLYGGSNPTGGFLWTPSAGFAEIPVYRPRAMNNRNQIVGSTSAPQNSFQRPVVWSPEGLVGSPPGLTVLSSNLLGEAFAINESGQIAGSLRDGDFSPSRAVLWNNGVALELGMLAERGGLQSTASGLNDLGQVVGSVNLEAPIIHGFLWDQGTMTELIPLIGSSGWAYDINNAGWIVGKSKSFGPFPQFEHAVLWLDGVPFDLNSLTTNLATDVTLVTATAVNDKGQIVGTAIVGEHQHGFLLSPTTLVETNTPISITLANPLPEATFPLGETIALQASANAPTGTIARVDFYAGNQVFASADQSPYLASWLPATSGPTCLKAVAVDLQGHINASEMVCIDITPAPPRYQLANIGELAVTGRNPFGLNSLGHFVGQARTENGNAAFIYKDGIITYLQIPAPRADSAVAINDSDQVVVSVGIRAGLFQDETLELLPTFPGSSSVSLGRAINATGMVVGQSKTDNQETHAALFFGASVTDIGVDLGQYSQANAINDSGVAVGWYQSAPGQPIQMFVYDATNGLQTLDPSLASLNNPQATGINNAGAIVGNSQNASGYQNAFLYQNGVVHDLGTPSGQHSFAQGINSSNQVVGHIGTSYTASRAFLAEGGQMVELNDLISATDTAILTEAVAINDKGQILADGFPTAAASERRIFLLNPIPKAGQTNQPPTVALQTPLENSVFYEGDNIPLLAAANDQDGSVSLVVFRTGSTVLGSSSTQPFGLVWPNAIAGTYPITATAFDDRGASNVSASVSITVRAFDTNAPAVVILGAAPADFSADIRQKLRHTELFSKVDIFPTDVSKGLTNFNQLNGYAAALVYSHLNANFSATVGNLLADYVESGRGVVLALNAADSSKPHLPGRFSTQGFVPWTDTRLSPHGSEIMLKDLPDHPILANVNSFGAGSAEYVELTILAPGSVRVASWDTQDPLAVAREIGGGRVVGLNFHPFSQEVSGYGWATNTDGAILLGNALTWASSSSSNHLDLATVGNTNQNNYLPGQDIALAVSGTNLPAGGLVRFYANGDLIASVTNVPASLAWTNPAVGHYLITGVYSNGLDHLVVSSGVNVSVDSRLTIELVTPKDGSVVYLPTNILMQVALSDPDAAVTNVDYYIDGTQRIGSATNAPFAFNFTQFSIGTLKFSAVAKDALGSIRTSSVHRVTVINNALPHLTKWIGSNGDWFVATNWTAGPPRIQDSAEIKKGTVAIATGSAVATNLTVGATNTATLVQSGSLTVGNRLVLGEDAGFIGNYRLEAPGLLSAGQFVVGSFGSAGAVQNGGSVTAGQLIVSANSTYVLSNGTLEASSEIVGLTTNAWFRQAGGTHRVTSSLEIGRPAHGVGYFQLLGGSLEASYEFIRGSINAGEGLTSFEQFGGDHRVTQELHLGDGGGAGELTVSGGSLRAQEFFIGVGGQLNLIADPATNRFAVTGIAHLAGRLNVALAPGYVPLGGDAITLMTYGFHSGTFAATNYPPSANGVVWGLEYQPTALVLRALPPPQVVIVSPYSADPQTNLFHQIVTISNHGSDPMQGARIYFPGLPRGWEIYNAAGEEDGIPFVEFDSVIPQASSVQFEVQFLIANDIRPAKQNFAVQLGDVAGVGAPGRPLQVDQLGIREDGSVAAQLATGRNRIYLVEYSEDLLHWTSVPQPIVATGGRTQWVDDGPPKTATLPNNRLARYYRILDVTDSTRSAQPE